MENIRNHKACLKPQKITNRSNPNPNPKRRQIDMCARTLISFVYVLESRGSRVMVFVLVRVPLLRAQRDPHRLLGPIGKPNQKEGKKMLTTQDNAPARGECNWSEQRHPWRRNPLPVSCNNPAPNTKRSYYTNKQSLILRSLKKDLGPGEGGEEIEFEVGIGLGQVVFGDGVLVIVPFPHHVVFEFVSERNERN